MTQLACRRCLARSWLLARLAGYLDAERSRIDQLLELDDDELIEAVGGRQRDSLARELNARRAGRGRRLDGVESVCRCHEHYPPRLRALAAPPAALHVAGGLQQFLAAARHDPVAIVGSRRPTGYGSLVARSLGRELAAAGLTVVSGLALGIDAAAHMGALDANGPTIAVMPGPADRPYPRQKRRLHRALLEHGAAVSELDGDVGVRRWMFPARNRLIAGLAATTVVVEAAERSGALLTAHAAAQIRRPLGAVPGRITAHGAAGPNALLAEGAYVVRGAQDVLDAVFGAGNRTVSVEVRPRLSREQRRLLLAIGEGADSPDVLARAGLGAEQAMAMIAELELDGYVRRGPGGRFEVVP